MNHAHTGISVVGTGTASSAPDVMRVDIGVSVRADTVSDASGQARERGNALVDSLVASGVRREDIATRSYVVHPEYDYTDGGQRLLGFRVGNEFQVTIRDIGQAGTVLDQAVAAVGDPLTVSGVQLTRDDETGARNIARQAAWEDALGRARQLADLAGVELGKVVSIVESAAGTPPIGPVARLAVAEATRIEPGETTTSVTLQVRFELS